VLAGRAALEAPVPASMHTLRPLPTCLAPAVDHVLVPCDPREDRSWLQSSPAVFTDACHAPDKTGVKVCVRVKWEGGREGSSGEAGGQVQACDARVKCQRLAQPPPRCSPPARARPPSPPPPRAGPNIDTPENWSEAVKRLKQRYLQVRGGQVEGVLGGGGGGARGQGGRAAPRDRSPPPQRAETPPPCVTPPPTSCRGAARD
jgi:hypothetical protein